MSSFFSQLIVVAIWNICERYIFQQPLRYQSNLQKYMQHWTWNVVHTYLQCTMIGPFISLCTLFTVSWNSTKEMRSFGVTMSFQPVYWSCVTTWTSFLWKDRCRIIWTNLLLGTVVLSYKRVSGSRGARVQKRNFLGRKLINVPHLTWA